MKNIFNDKKTIILFVLAEIYYFCISLFKLNYTPLWQDEAAEFYCSVATYGPITGVSDLLTMYERGLSIQQQPPLYNWVMMIWIFFGESEFWIRFLGVMLVFISTLVLFYTINRLTNPYIASLSVVVFSSIYVIQFYIKEASEYSLMFIFTALIMSVYISILAEPTKKKALCFTVLCVLAIYTQYGTAFLIVPMAIQLWVYYLKRKEYKILKLSIISEIIAAIGLGLPLVYFYLLPQTNNPVSTIGTSYPIDIKDGNLIIDFFDSIMWTIRWFLLDYNRDGARFEGFIWLLVFVLLALFIFVHIKTKDDRLKYLIRCNLWVYLIYYVCTTLTIYAYGWFGNRYGFFMFHLLFITIVWSIYEFIQMIKDSQIRNCSLKKGGSVLNIAVVIVSLLFCIYGVKRVNDHWDKMDLRTVVSYWYENDCSDIPLFVNVNQRYSFTYYFTHNDNYSEDLWANIYSNINAESLYYDEAGWLEYLQTEVYPDGIPEELYIISSYKDTVIEVLESLGYESEYVVGTTTDMYLLKKVTNN